MKPTQCPRKIFGLAISHQEIHPRELPCNDISTRIGNVAFFFIVAKEKKKGNNPNGTG